MPRSRPPRFGEVVEVGRVLIKRRVANVVGPFNAHSS